jgi:carboxylate-amine ligase
MRTFGVEEELLIVDQTTGHPVAASRQLLHRRDRAMSSPYASSPEMTAEMQQEMIEVVTSPHESLASLADEIRNGRALADRSARRVGARAVALATCPTSVHPHPNQRQRYQVMMERYGTTARNSLACGQHVHVSIDTREEGVAILDRIRVWLPTLIALSANSPFCNGEDTGYASYRSVTWRQWPSAGPTDIFGSFAAYREYEEQLLATGTLLDAAMLYFDARLSRNHPTIEVRVADVCLDASASATIAGVVRGLVETAATEWQLGRCAPPVSAGAIRLASWAAGRSGLAGDLVDPLTGHPKPARAVIGLLLEHIRPALEAADDWDAITSGVDDLLVNGTGADWQRQTFADTGRFEAVLLLAADATQRPVDAR